jgi:hypothetical protein
MISKPLVVGLLAAACITAAAGGAYVAVRQNEASRTAGQPVSVAPASAAQAVAETEAVVTPAKPRDAADSAPSVPAAQLRVEEPRTASTVKKPAPRMSRTSPSANESRPARPASEPPAPVSIERPSPSREPVSTPPTPLPTPPAQPEPVLPETPPAPARPQFMEVVVPASSVVGLQVESAVTSETARVEDRVEARVTRDVIADGRLAVPAGTRAIGDVVLVERGGKMKDKARLGVRFHTLVLADGRHVAFRTDSIFREGSSPGAESARKIGGAAIGGAVLGAILGGAKGAAIGGATGAAGGSAVVMAGDRNPATLPAGTIVTVRLASPMSLDVEKEM